MMENQIRDKERGTIQRIPNKKINKYGIGKLS